MKSKYYKIWLPKVHFGNSSHRVYKLKEKWRQHFEFKRRRGDETAGVIPWLTMVYKHKLLKYKKRKKRKLMNSAAVPQSFWCCCSKNRNRTIKLTHSPSSPLSSLTTTSAHSLHFCNFPCQRNACADTWFCGNHSSQHPALHMMSVQVCQRSFTAISVDAWLLLV